MRTTKIVKIEALAEKYDKYDLTVSGTHNFFANGILIHNCQNLADWCNTLKGVKWEATLKMDGSSCTMGYSPSNRTDKEPFFVCSRNFELKHDEATSETGTYDKSAWWEMAVKYGLEEKLAAYCQKYDCELALQGELVGPGMNGNRDKLEERGFYVFRIWDIGKQRFLMSDERYAVCQELGIPHVPVLRRYMDVFEELPTVDDILKFAEGKTASGHEREGVVFKEEGTWHPRSFKAVSNKYLLQQG